MNVVATFDPSITTTGTFTVPQAQGKMVIWNESNISLQLSFQNGHTAYVAAWTGMLFCGPWGGSTVTWSHQAILSSSSPPISQVIVEVYAISEPVPGTFPMALVRQSNVGNPGGVAVSSISSLSNTGNAPGTNVINVQPSDAAASTWTADNSGNFTVKGDNAGVLTTLIQLIAGASPGVKLAAATILTEVLGNLQVDGTTSLDNGLIVTDGVGDMTFANNNGIQGKDGGGTVRALLYVSGGDSTILQAAGADSITFRDRQGSTNRVSIDSTGLNLLANTINLLTGSLSRISRFTGTSAVGKVTVNHGLGAIPDLCEAFFIVGSTPSPHTIACNHATLTGTTVDVWCDVGGIGFEGFAIKF